MTFFLCLKGYQQHFIVSSSSILILYFLLIWNQNHFSSKYITLINLPTLDVTLQFFISKHLQIFDLFDLIIFLYFTIPLQSFNYQDIVIASLIPVVLVDFLIDSYFLVIH